jgi:hypothetical protein
MMQLRCTNCHRPFALSRDAVHAALEQVTSQDLSHFNAQCPHCRRVNRVSKKQLQRAAPNWTPESTTDVTTEETSSEEAENA